MELILSTLLILMLLVGLFFLRMKKPTRLVVLPLIALFLLTSCGAQTEQSASNSTSSIQRTKQEIISSSHQPSSSSTQKTTTEESTKKTDKTIQEKEARESAEEKKRQTEESLAVEQATIDAQQEAEAEQQKDQEQALIQLTATITQVNQELASYEFAGTQTIPVNNNEPLFSEQDLSLTNGAWEIYSPLDDFNRATSAEAMLNQCLMPKEKRGDISNVKPTGWHNKKLGKGYLFNRSHLIGYALSGENDNWKNLITGTAQLNNPEMLRHEMDIKTYLDQSPDHYVRYSVTPVFRGEELLARGVHLMAQSVGEEKIKFNVYIFNIQDDVQLNYADGTSQLLSASTPSESLPSSKEPDSQESSAQEAAPPSESLPAIEGGQYVDANGNGLIKGSKSQIYHVPGSEYYDRTTAPVAWFKTIAEAEQAGYRAPR